MGFWEDWERRLWGRRPWRAFDRLFEDLNRMFEDMVRDLQRYPQEAIKERTLPDGSKMRTLGPFVYGYSLSVGPDGKPTVREFGNVKPTILGIPKPAEQREPLVDVLVGDKVVQVIAEVPGVEKKDIDLRTSDEKLTISVDTPARKYYREVDLPAKVVPSSAKATYKNGVLEVTLNKVEEEKRPPPGERVEIE